MPPFAFRPPRHPPFTMVKKVVGAARERPKRRHLTVDVQWADITRADGDAFVVGHYIGVQPQHAELALDRALSETGDPSKLLLTELTRRGAIRGALGDITFFPWTHGRQVVLAGMGRPGTFGASQLRLLARQMIHTVGRLMKGRTICTVLIGSGIGNLTVRDAVSGLMMGAAEALVADRSLNPGRLRIVERQLDRAYEILETLRQAAPEVLKAHGVTLRIGKDVVERARSGGVIPIPFGFSLMLARMAQAYHGGTSDPLHDSVEALVRELPSQLRPGVRATLKRLGSEPNPRRLGLAFRIGGEDQPPPGEIADRVSFSHDGKVVRTAAITNMTTVTERELAARLPWVDRIVEELYAATPQNAEALARDAYARLIHDEIKEKIEARDTPLVVEVDRTMARVPWEMLQEKSSSLPLAVRRPLARQLRTTYSPRIAHWDPRGISRALVIGDPDDSLPYARAEAEAVARLLTDDGVVVELRVGAPDELGLGRDGRKAADLFEIVGLLQSGEFDLVHYSGHAVFVAEYPDRSGWVFKEEVFTPSRLENVESPPRLIVANACLSARIAGDAQFVASLADEFFRRGVADYIGTAWEVPELPATIFAELFYKALLASNAPLGRAVQNARRTLFDRRAEWKEFATVWSAYQHYGDPTRVLSTAE